MRGVNGIDKIALHGECGIDKIAGRGECGIGKIAGRGECGIDKIAGRGLYLSYYISCSWPRRGNEPGDSSASGNSNIPAMYRAQAGHKVMEWRLGMHDNGV